MKRRDLLLVAAGLGSSALATGLPAHAAGGGGEADDKESKKARIVELKNVVFPVGDEEGRLVNYLFVDIDLHVIDSGKLWSLREDAHLLRDSIIRVAHRISLAVPNEPGKLDHARAGRVCLEALAQDGYPGAFSSASFPKADSRRDFAGSS